MAWWSWTSGVFSAVFIAALYSSDWFYVAVAGVGAGIAAAIAIAANEGEDTT